MMYDEQEVINHVRLQFNVAHPDLEEIWQAGYECAEQKQLLSANPYKAHTTDHFHWAEGWWAGYYEVNIEQIAANQPQFLRWSQESRFFTMAQLFGNILGGLMASIVCYEILDMAI